MIVNGRPINYDKVPAQHMASGMKRYIEQGIEPGDFMVSVLCNDLRGAMMRADSINANLLKEWLYWLMEYAPSACWGSPEKVEAWMKTCQEQRLKAANDG